MAREPRRRKPPRAVKPATPDPGEERVRRDNPNAVTMDGKMRKHNIRVLPGDRVVIELSPSDLTRGRSTFRHR